LGRPRGRLWLVERTATQGVAGQTVFVLAAHGRAFVFRAGVDAMAEMVPMLRQWLMLKALSSQHQGIWTSIH
jgi:hypothetical protein